MTQMNWPFLGLRDPISSGTHAAACVWAIFSTLLLMRLCQSNRRRQFALAVFGSSLIVQYGISALYHAIAASQQVVHVFQLLDHSAIYYLIAGTHYPVFCLLPRNRLRTALAWAMALIAVAGISSEWLLPRPPYWLTVGAYVGMGWMGLLLLAPLLRMVGIRGVLWIAYGGLAYTLGAFLDLVNWPNLAPGVFGPHELFHLLTIAGSLCHFVFFVRYLLPRCQASALPNPLLPEPALALIPVKNETAHRT